MGIFFEHQAASGPRPGADADAHASPGTTLGTTTTFNGRRFFVALAMFGALVIGGVAADIGGHYASSTALYGFAGTVFGVVAAFLGTEKSASG
jgi:hypothetical protein